MTALGRTIGVAAAVAVSAALASGSDARGATADVLAKDRVYCASTHPNHGTPEGFGPAIDLNGRNEDYRWPIHAPGEGRVRTSSAGGGFGYSVVWKSLNGRERIHLAHLDSFGRTGRVEAGAEIGRMGSTGFSTGPHLHLSASVAGRPAPVVLHGETIRAGHCYRSRGPIPPRCHGRDATILGTSHGDHLSGTRVEDVFVGGRGRDVLHGRAGRDAICGGPGRDRTGGEGGADVLLGSAGDDRMRGGSGADAFAGSRGADRAVAGPGRDLVIGGAGVDRLLGAAGADRLVGGSGSDVVRGLGRSDLLRGGPGADVMVGGPGSDTLAGKSDPDRLSGGSGGDRLFGGWGADRFRAGGGRDRAYGGGGDDAIDGGPAADALFGGVGFDLVAYTHADSGVHASLADGKAITAGGVEALAGFEALRGSPHGDELAGDALDNTIYGGNGDDTLDGRAGTNHLDGGEGFDSCLAAATQERCEA